MPPDRREYLGTGWRFPIRPGATGALAWSGGEQKVGESLWLLLSTALGERVMRPRVGCGVHALLLANDTPPTRALIAHHVRETLVTYEARIDVLDVRVTDDGATGAALAVEVDYRIRENNAINNLVYPLYATEGTAAVAPGRA